MRPKTNEILPDSGSSPLAKLPSNWRYTKLKWIARLAYGNALSAENRVDGQFPVFGSNGEVGTHHVPNTMAPTILIGRKGSYGRVNFSHKPGFAIDTTYFIDARTSRHHLRWLYYALSVLGLDRSSQDCGVPGLSRVFAHEQMVPLPPFPEQVAIADFLDRQTGKIDVLIAKKERLIELLQEKRTALISGAVTQGINGKAHRKDSGIPWLGEIPAHWQLKKIGFFANVGNGSTPERGNTDYWAGGDYPWLNSSVVNDENVTNSSDFVTPVALRECHLPIVGPGSVLVAITGEGKTRGMAAVLRFEATINQHLAFITPDSRLANGDFLRAALASRYEVLRFISEGTGSTKGALTCEQLRQFKVPLPPLPEQQAIAEHLDRQNAKINSLLVKVRTAIERLQEYRTALISAAVTGRIDVRQAQTHIPDRPTKPPSPAFRRTVFAAEIIENCHDQPTFGHVKFQKMLHLAEYHLGLQDFDSNYYRQAAGPYDNQMLRSIDRQLETSKWFRPSRTGHAVTYSPMEKAGTHRKYFDQYWGEHRDGLEKLITLLAKFNTEQCEIVSTLYAVWNDFLLAGVPFDDETIVNDAIAWHPEKRRIERDRWMKALAWMRQQGLVPRGTGKPVKVKK